jgi:tetratricopeptide (TPR) repeat protein
MVARDPRAAFRKRVPVGPLAPQVAAEVPRALGARPRASDDRRAMENLAAKELAGLPIALTLAALYVKDSGRSWTAYAGRLRTQTRLIAEERDPPAGYPASALAAVDIAIDRCARDTPARRLLEGAAVFAPEAVPIAWAAGAADRDLDRAELGAIAALGLVTVDDATQTLSMHRLVHRRVRDLVPMDAWVATSRRAAATAAVWLSHRAGAAHLAELDAYRAHIDEALAAADRSGSDLAWVIMADRLAAHLGARARHEEARSLFERAITIAERLDPPNPGQVRASLSNLGGLLLEMGRAREARPILERALSIDESLEDAPVSVRLARLSRALLSAGRAEAAVPLLSRALTMGEAPGEEAAPRLPDSALVLRELKHAESPLLVRALAGEGEEGAALAATLRAVEQGASSPPSGRGNEDSMSLRSLGLSLYALGHPGDARPLLERALACDEAAHGPTHPDVAADLLDLGAVLRSLGEDAAARACLVRARAIASLLLDPADPLRVGIEARLKKL